MKREVIIAPDGTISLGAPVVSIEEFEKLLGKVERLHGPGGVSRLLGRDEVDGRLQEIERRAIEEEKWDLQDILFTQFYIILKEACERA